MLKRALISFWRDARGVSAVEFALILPVMLVLLMGGVELGSALTAARKAQTVASSVADLVAQGKTINDGQMADIFTAANALMRPYDPSQIKIVVSSIYFDQATQQARVRWSRALNDTPLAPNTVVTLPQGILTSSATSVIMAKSRYFFRTSFGKFLTEGVTMEDTFYARPRLSTEVVYQ